MGAVVHQAVPIVISRRRLRIFHLNRSLDPADSGFFGAGIDNVRVL
jgi:hypothetical protein